MALPGRGAWRAAAAGQRRMVAFSEGVRSGYGDSDIPGGLEHVDEGRPAFKREKWGKTDKRVKEQWKDPGVMDRQATWAGPKPGSTQWVEENYVGNLQTPNWLLGENGDEIAAKCKEVFRGYDKINKKPVGNFKMWLTPGKATAGPPVGPTFSSMGVKSIDFVKAFNDRTAGVFAADPELKLRVQVRFYEDKTYQWKIKPPKSAYLLRKVARLAPSPSGKGSGHGPGPLGGDDPYAYVTLQQLYHVAALLNTWDHTPDWFPLEARVVGLFSQCFQMGLIVLGHGTAAPPQMGFTDEQFAAHIKVKKAEWMAKRRKELDLNPLLRVPWMQKHRMNVWSGIQLPHIEREGDVPTPKQIIKDAQAVDKQFQELFDDQEALKDRHKVNKVYWEQWKETGMLQKDIEIRHPIEENQIAMERERRVKYLAKRYPSVVHRQRNFRALWHSNDYDQLKGNEEPLHTRIR
eukprot:TRINITY_DN30346_c0_g1_i1.p2 TRINITY_DN30346_c0_g1~~TRINITY_DN30346_c0_g1_i1.p2  ORF type:complete len:484 (+),score=197.35 TRINITY_DN30346_c0_g1_i1:70-1452(+)